MTGLLTLEEVALRLGVSRRRVQALVQAGHLPAERVGRQWVVEPSALAQADNMRTVRPGRPMEAGSAWRRIRSVEQGAVRMSPRSMDAFRRQVRKRATNRRLYVHRSEVQALTTDPAVVIGGAGAAIAEGVPLDAPEICDLYSRLSAVDGLLARTKASEDREGNIIVHAVIDREWPFRPEDRYGGLWVAWLDLADRLDRSADLLADRLVGGRHRA